MAANTSRTHDYDPRYDRAQTADGAKARYVQLDDHPLAKLELDIERILSEGENPDRPDPALTEPEMGYF